MKIRYADVIAAVTATSQQQVVSVTLSIHDENGGAWFASGNLRYRRVRTFPKGFQHQLASRVGGSGNDWVIVLNNFAFDTSVGSSGLYQSFLVTQPPAEPWVFVVSQQIPVRPATSTSPLILSVQMPQRPQRGTINVAVQESGTFLVGVGAAPYDAALQAAYVLAFHSLSPYVEIG